MSNLQTNSVDYLERILADWETNDLMSDFMAQSDQPNPSVAPQPYSSHTNLNESDLQNNNVLQSDALYAAEPSSLQSLPSSMNESNALVDQFLEEFLSLPSEESSSPDNSSLLTPSPPYFDLYYFDLSSTAGMQQIEEIIMNEVMAYLPAPYSDMHATPQPTELSDINTDSLNLSQILQLANEFMVTVDALDDQACAAILNAPFPEVQDQEELIDQILRQNQDQFQNLQYLQEQFENVQNMEIAALNSADQTSASIQSNENENIRQVWCLACQSFYPETEWLYHHAHLW